MQHATGIKKASTRPRLQASYVLFRTGIGMAILHVTCGISISSNNRIVDLLVASALRCGPPLLAKFQDNIPKRSKCDNQAYTGKRAHLVSL
jgi:hypothetical protein